ncbi:MAG: CotH kinase family protein [Tannerella sp.]|jgi:hypothetical protein|nr:CotH kinase family protein [Tannerella sp.]
MTEKKISFLILLLSCSFHAKTQTEQELTGALMFVDLYDNQAYPASSVFDNDPATCFASYPPFGNWIGLDLRQKHVITKIAYRPGMESETSDSPDSPDVETDESLQLGLFEGANSPDFSDAIPLHIIPGPVERGLTEQPVLCTRGFRYVRFVFPYAIDKNKISYLAELKFYGYRGAGNDSKLPQLTNLPVVSIHTENCQVIDKNNYVKGFISVIYDGGTKIHSGSLEIRGRGNNSWDYPKKPYRLRLSEETRLLDLPANARNWTLINNYGDKTLMRNMLAFDFSRRLEMPYTSPAEAVDVILNGDYKGCYQLCDHIDVRENRVEIDELSPANVSGEKLTGGYLIEIDAYYYNEPITFMSSHYKIPVTIQYPDNRDIVGAQVAYIENHFNRLTKAVYEDSLLEDSENGFRKYLHTDVFLKHFLTGEYAGNTDTYWSVKMYKNRGDDRFVFAPVWDFDLAFENDRRTYPINGKTEWLSLSSYSSAAGDTRNFIRRIMSDSSMIIRLKEIYNYYLEQNILSKDTLLKVVDDYAALLEQSQDLNFKRWPIMNELVHSNPVIHGSYAAEVENVRKYVSERLDWIDCKLNCDPDPENTEAVDGYNRIKLKTGKGLIRIEGVNEPVAVRVTDMSGRILFNRTIAEYSADISADRGIYIVTVDGGSAQKQIYKTIVP